MKKSILLVLLLVLLQNAFAQDKIIKQNGEEIKARVVEIKLQEIVFQHPDSLTGTLYHLPKTDVFMIQFANGTKEVFAQNVAEASAEGVNISNPEEMYELGRDDARKMYRGNGAMWGSAGCAFVFPYGLAGSAAIGLTKPKAHRNPVSNVSYLADPNYVRGYEMQAHRKKAGKVVAGAGIGFVTAISVVVIMFSSMHH
ncbi:hypothetical protein [Pontibacter cellulosilyticus]|uniref:Uncharacterized protein n=1 Tax=Pontibacter cellulosilyticus TaxID=1720253 RepID=A0A923SPG3_9BACT|nr:hypothetical protein [Pontibacter cellulosilyticus]MBC5994120.1 hypothetical protein [Pontibacter cellulosilyticus]